MPPESRSVLLAIAAASVIAPLIGWVLARCFPPAAKPSHAPTQQRWRYRAIEYGGVLCSLIGVSLPFMWWGTSAVEPSAFNITVLLSAAIVSMIGGVALLSTVFADRGTDGFIDYFESEYNIHARVVRIGARGLFVAAFVALIATLALGH